MRFAARLSRISASPTVSVMQEAQDLRARGIDVIDLGPGLPDFHTPDSIKAAGLEAIQSDFTTYTATAGIGPLRQAIAERYNRQWGSAFDARNVIVTCGAKHALFNLCLSVFEKGQEVLIPAPFWVTFPEAVKLAGASPVFMPTSEGEGFVVSARAISKALSPATRGLILNTPNNPSGAVIPALEMQQIAAIAREHSIFVLSDETYDYFTYECSHSSLASSLGSEDDDFAIVGSFSKTYAMTGWRIGYCLGPRSLISKLDELQSHQTGNPTSISQKAALAALAGDGGDLENMRKVYRQRRDFVLERLEAMPGFTCTRPEGAFYLFPNVRGATHQTGCEGSLGFSKFILRHARVATVPGAAFGCEGHLRLSYATSMEQLREAMDRIEALLQGKDV